MSSGTGISLHYSMYANSMQTDDTEPALHAVAEGMINDRAVRNSWRRSPLALALQASLGLMNWWERPSLGCATRTERPDQAMLPLWLYRVRGPGGRVLAAIGSWEKLWNGVRWAFVLVVAVRGRCFAAREGGHGALESR